MSKAPASVLGQKRKHGSDTRTTAPASRKRQKAQDARNISTQPSKAGLSAAGELNVAAFVKAREHEINAMDRSMEKSRKGLMSRAFQQVPRRMRRRTASHNVKKIPKRLRPRAAKEMKEDNTPTVVAKKRVPSAKIRLRQDVARSIQNWSMKTKTVRQEKRETVARAKAKAKGQPLPLPEPRIPRIKTNTLANPPLATSKFKRRQVRKAWLPTHLWHAKRAHMTKPREPLWRMAIALSPTDKVYRTTHRSSGARGCVAWDMSYMSTMSCRGTAAALESLLKGFGFHGEGWKGVRYQRWRRGIRVAHGWASARDGLHDLIAAISVFWCIERQAVDDVVSDLTQATPPVAVPSAGGEPTDTAVQSKKRKLKSSLMIRCHPSAFHQVWLELLKVAKIQRPQVLVEDLRFEIGSILVTGPESTAALKAVLEPIDRTDTVGGSWTALPSAANPGTLPQNCLFGFNISDPRLKSPPRHAEATQSLEIASAELLVSWPPDQSEITPDIFSHKRRYHATHSLLSQKSINRRKVDQASGTKLEAKESDSQIPLILYTTRANASGQSSWTLLAPWRAIDPIWRSLMYCPLPSGGTPRFGGLNETRQIAFEQQEAWFPGDMPGTEAGQVWDRTESETRFDDWVKRPEKSRVAWDKVALGMDRKGEHGNGWTCDWEYLFGSDTSQQVPIAEDSEQSKEAAPSRKSVPKTKPKLRTTRQRKAAKAETEAQEAEAAARRRNTSSPETDDGVAPLSSTEAVEYTHLTPFDAQTLLAQPSTSNQTSSSQRSLFTIRLTYLSRGTPQPCARIYRLPTSSSTTSTTTSTTSAISIRDLWLTHLHHLTHSPSFTSTFTSTTQLPPSLHRLPKLKLNRHAQPRHQLTHGREYIHHITHIPPDCPPSVLAATAPIPKPADWDDKNKGGERVDFAHNDVAGEDERKGVPKDCPGEEDLIGFVTSGGFNLRMGRGTGMGGLWGERVVEGWRRQEEGAGGGGKRKVLEEDGGEDVAMAVGDVGEKKGLKSSTKVESDKEWKEIERHLCIVRNAGESQARLATWEVWIPSW